MKIAALVVLCCLLSLPLGAAEPTAESVEKLFVVTKVQASIDAVRDGMGQRMKVAMAEMMKAYPGNPKLDKVAGELSERWGREFGEALKWEKLKDSYIKLYQETFTQEEVDAQIAFSETPVGKSIVEKTPALSVKSAQIAHQRYLPLLQQMQKTIKEEFEKAVREE